MRPTSTPIVGIACVALVAATIEMVALVLVALSATALADGEQRVEASIAGQAIDLGLGRALLFAAGLVVASAVVRAVAIAMQTRLVASTELALRTRIAAAFMDARHGAQQALNGGEIVDHYSRSVLQAGAGVVAESKFWRAVAGLIIFIGGALVVNPVAASTLVVVGIVLVAALLPLTRAVRRAARAFVAENNDQATLLDETVRMAREVRVFQADGWAATRLTSTAENVATLRDRTQRLVGLTPVVYQAVGVLFLIAMLAAVRMLDTPDVAALGGIAILLLRCISFGQQAQGSWQRMSEAGANAVRLEELIDDLSTQRQIDGTTDVADVNAIRFEAVSFAYPNGETDTRATPGGGLELALDGVDLDMAIGETIGVVGPSGSGKSTLAAIMLRLHEPTAGRVLVDDVDLSDVTARSWYSTVGFVPQSTSLVNATVADNIAFFREGFSRADIVEAATAAGLHDAIDGLPQGYDTPIGPETRDLSGGQSQRLGIARALVGRPRILVLDEPTSALDTRSEQLVAATIDRLAGDRLIIVIAHRQSTLGACDRVVVLENGRIGFDGPPEAMRANNEFAFESFAV